MHFDSSRYSHVGVTQARKKKYNGVLLETRSHLCDCLLECKDSMKIDQELIGLGSFRGLEGLENSHTVFAILRISQTREI